MENGTFAPHDHIIFRNLLRRPKALVWSKELSYGMMKI